MNLNRLADTSAQMYQQIANIKNKHADLRMQIIRDFEGVATRLYEADIALQYELDELMNGPRLQTQEPVDAQPSGPLEK